MRPPPIGGAVMPGSTPAGGQITPFDCESLSLNALPVVSFERGVLLSGGHVFSAGGWMGDGAAPGRSDCARAAGADAAAMDEAAITAATIAIYMVGFLFRMRCSRRSGLSLTRR